MLYRNYYNSLTTTLLKSMIFYHTRSMDVGPPPLQGYISYWECSQICLKHLLQTVERELLISSWHLSNLLTVKRRAALKLCMLFNILPGNVFSSFTPLTYRFTPYTNRALNSSQLTFCCSNCFKHSCFLSASAGWNDLPFDTSKVSLLVVFKRTIMQLYRPYPPTFVVVHV